MYILFLLRVEIYDINKQFDSGKQGSYTRSTLEEYLKKIYQTFLHRLWRASQMSDMSKDHLDEILLEELFFFLKCFEIWNIYVAPSAITEYHDDVFWVSFSFYLKVDLHSVIHALLHGEALFL